MTRIGIFDLDGTLIDSDEALLAPFVALGVPRDQVTFGHVLQHECTRLGLDVQDYLDHYDATLAQPFAGARTLVEQLERWAVCSNKHPASGVAELARLGWQPELALFADSFGGPKRLEPVLEHMSLTADDIVFVGDTAHDRACAQAVGCRFVLAGWNPRSRPEPGDLVAATPVDVLAILRDG